MAAGQGFKTFTTGEVLTAGDVNGYLMQGINVFASNAARDAAITSPQEGQFAYTKDTNSLWYYTGSAWAASGATGDIEGVTATSPLTGGGTSGTVTVGIQDASTSQKGAVQLSDSVASTSTSLAATANAVKTAYDLAASASSPTSYGFTAGKNKIINGDYNINQRAFTSSTSTDLYTFDRWNKASSSDGTATVSAQTFTTGSAPVSGYESANFIRCATASQTLTSAYTQISQKIEDVRTYAGQTVTYSFWAKAASGTPKIALEMRQYFGTGGSPSTGVNTYAGQATLSTSWARYSITVAIPSISGKTIGTTAYTSYLQPVMWLSAGSDYNSATGSLGLQNSTIDIWGVQLEAGSTATTFQTASGTVGGELALCQRYYQRSTNSGDMTAPGLSAGSSQAYFTAPLVVQMRKLVSLDYSGAQVYTGNAFGSVSSITLQSSDTTRLQLNVSGSGFGTWGASLMLSVTYLAINGEL